MRYCTRRDDLVNFTSQELEVLPAAAYRHADLDDCDSDPSWGTNRPSTPEDDWRVDNGYET